MSAVFVSAAELRSELAGATPPIVFDATLVLRRPRHDGDFTAESGRARWAAGHIPGSRHVAIDSEFSVPHPVTHDHHPEPQQLADRLAALGVALGDRVVAYDTVGGLWAARLWYLLSGIGVDARVLDGGLAAWRDAEGPVSDDDAPARPPVAPWPARAIRPQWVERDEIVALPPHGNLVCGLGRAAFAGAEPTRYHRRGHIPGSVNVPARELFDDDGRVRSPDEIRDAFAAEGVDLDAEVLLYCGGGISATANALALAHAGVDDVRVYDGSLEEWSADPVLPLVTLAPAL
ncbi:sulfurtransferase [Microbacterium fluvii]|uniref:Sulfurtransferase n=1 Tax=Microbacterium fluvii TaxID=415215 RepID=A0ABW2HCE1_9MICO|nr:rhodanese-like domain-containing protein [Microbacterium fluvii]MCU4672433.1 rhodanese-like domain-containing protein [Microbacterium fluvii]